MNDNRSTDSDRSVMEELLLFKVGLIAAGVVAGSIFSMKTWHRSLDWLVEHQVLVATSDSPLVALPASDGVGLDGPRIAIAVAAVVFLLVCGVTGLRRHLAAGADERRV